jgi:hypothetical protein
MYFQNKKYKKNMFSKIIFFIFKISLLKTFNFKFILQKHVRIKIIIIIVLQPNTEVDSGQDSSHRSI